VSTARRSRRSRRQGSPGLGRPESPSGWPRHLARNPLCRPRAGASAGRSTSQGRRHVPVTTPRGLPRFPLVARETVAGDERHIAFVGCNGPGSASSPTPVRGLRMNQEARQLTEPFSPNCVGDLRRWARSWMARQQCSADPDSVVLAMTEMVTNSVRHGSSPVDVEISVVAGLVLLRVSDCSDDMPRQPRSGESATGGRGIALIDAVTSRWGVQYRPIGKTVWCEFAAGAGRLDAAAALTDQDRPCSSAPARPTSCRPDRPGKRWTG
jgi:anti-sigma regulatory factor (Ser/Thr protein kinase)